MARRETPLARYGVLLVQAASGAVAVDQVIVVGSAAWYRWLEDASVFAYQDDTGVFTARKERFKRGGWYWKAYRRRRGRLTRVYLGKSSQLTWDALQRAARRLAGEVTSRQTRSLISPDLERAPGASDLNSSDPSDSLDIGGGHDSRPDRRGEQAQHTPQAILGARLVPSKLARPRLPLDLVPRRRLTEALQRLVEVPLTAIVAPAGYGKTTLLMEWASSSVPHVGWLTLDASDNDPVRFWLHVAATLERATGEAPRASALIEGGGADALDAALATLVERLNHHQGYSDVQDAQDEPVYLALDDYHEIENRAIHERLCMLIERAPLIHVLLASRSDLPAEFSRLLARGQACALPDAALRFTGEEGAAFLLRHGGANVSSTTTKLLHERLEGWAAGWRFAALMLQAEPREAPATLESLLLTLARGESHLLADYLSAEVLRRVSEHERNFLLATSILDRLCAPLCDAVTGRNDAREMLERLERMHLFLTPLGPEVEVSDHGMVHEQDRGWYRYHPLFASVLRAQSRARDASAVTDAHERAARWYEAQGEVEEALRHALRARDPALALHMIERYGTGFLQRGETATVLGWLDALPAGAAQRWPRVTLQRAQALLVTGQVEAAEAFVEQAEQAILDAAQPVGQGNGVEVMADIARAEAHAARATIAATRGDYPQAITGYHRALSFLPDADTSTRATITSDLAGILTLSGQPGAAITAYRSAYRAQDALGDPVGMLDVLWSMGTLLMTQAELPAAARVFQRAIHLSADAPGGPLPAASAAYHYLSRIFYEWDRCEEALPLLETSLRLNVINGDVGLETRSLLLLGKLRLAAGDTEGTRACIDRAERIERTPGMRPGVARTAGAVSAYLAYLLGDVAQTAAWAKEMGLENASVFAAADDFTRLTYIRLLLAQGNPDTAAELLDLVCEGAPLASRVDILIEIEMLLARAEQARKRQERALVALQHALLRAEKGRYIRLALDEGAPILALIARLSQTLTSVPGASSQESMEVERDVRQDGRLAAYLTDLTTAACRMAERELGRRGTQGPLPGPLPGPLSQREIEVVRRVAAGMSNVQIARDLVVEPSTIKWHVHNIIQKLDARSRTGAVARSHELGLL